MVLPALRAIDAAPVEHDGKTFICLSDPQGYAEESVVLSPAAFFIATLLDGRNGVTDIQYHFVNESGGRILSEEDIAKVVEHLDEHGFLLTERFDALRAEAVRAFAGERVRAATLAGAAYPENPDELRAFLDGLCAQDSGRGARPQQGGHNAGLVRCLIAPHIDYERGGEAYAHAYQRLAEGKPPATALVFGVAHAGPPAPIILTKKAYHTPFGPVPVDEGLLEELAVACPWDPFEHEITHRNEHSIEFQAVMLAHLFGPDVRMVPVLCGGATDPESGADPAVEMSGFLDACRDAVAARDGAVAVIAAADLAHVGLSFGDDFDIDEEVVARVRERDMEDLAHVLKPDAAAWHASVTRDGNARRVCGLNCIYAALRSVEGTATAGELLHYGYAPDPAGGMVSFAAVAVV